tara:strand:- start:752 stop:1234 length:483 start_codon:yes stop_codon:yes gene_type:complete
MTFTMLSTTSDFHLGEDARIAACSYAESIATTSFELNLDPFVLSALIFQESRFETNAKSPQGACGLTQVVAKYVPATCKQLTSNPVLSIEIGATLLKDWLRRNDNSYDKSLQCYATGYKCNHPLYAKKVLTRSKKLKKIYLLTKRKMNNALDQRNLNRSQ